MSELTYFRCNVKIEFEDRKGRTKYRKELYIVKAVNPTDVESKMNEYLKSIDFQIDSISQIKIVDIIK